MFLAILITMTIYLCDCPVALSSWKTVGTHKYFLNENVHLESSKFLFLITRILLTPKKVAATSKEQVSIHYQNIFRHFCGHLPHRCGCLLVRILPFPFPNGPWFSSTLPLSMWPIVLRGSRSYPRSKAESRQCTLSVVISMTLVLMVQKQAYT